MHHAELHKHFNAHFDFEICLTSLVFHPQAFVGQCAATVINNHKGPDARLAFIDACYTHQGMYMKAAMPDPRPSEVRAVFGEIAKGAGLVDNGSLSLAEFIKEMEDWDKTVGPARTEHREALQYGVFGTPKHVIDGSLIADTESAWGVKEWEEKLKELKLL